MGATLFDTAAAQDRLLSDCRSRALTASGSIPVQCFFTSIWDESLYFAWSAIVQTLLPSPDRLRTLLAELCNACDAAEVVLLDAATLMTLSAAESQVDSKQPALTKLGNENRHERIAWILKSFSVSVAKWLGSNNHRHISIQLQHKDFLFVLHQFTESAVVVVVTRPGSKSPAIIGNIQRAAAKASQGHLC